MLTEVKTRLLILQVKSFGVTVFRFLLLLNKKPLLNTLTSLWTK